jgi:hypothetical protein
MKTSEVLDSDKEEFSMLTARQKYALTIFALLDAVSILRSYPEISSIFEYGPELNGLWLVRLIIIASFAFSAIFFMLRRKEALVLYYIQFPLRLLFMMLSFGFIIELFGGVFGSSTYWTAITIVFGLEVLRLVYTIVIHRQLNRNNYV